MISLGIKDLHWILSRTPKQVIAILKERPARVFMAGGFIRACIANETVADIDLFAPSKDEAELIALKIEAERRWNSANAITVYLKDPLPPIQVIHRWVYDKPEDLIESFDFTIAKSVVWFDGSEWQSLCHDDFYIDLAAKRLTYTMPKRNEDAGGSMLRVLKFYQKGYRIPLDSLAAVTARLVMAVDFQKLSAIHQDKEVALTGVLTGLLREVDPLQDPQHLFHLPSGGEDAKT